MYNKLTYFFVYRLLLFWILFNHVFKEPIDTVYYFLLDSEPKHLSYRNESIAVNNKKESWIERKSILMFCFFFTFLSNRVFISIFLKRCFFSTSFASVWSNSYFLTFFCIFNNESKHAHCSSFNTLNSRLILHYFAIMCGAAHHWCLIYYKTYAFAWLESLHDQRYY